MGNRSPYLNSKVVVPAVMLVAMTGYLTMALHMGRFFIGTKTGEAFFPLLLGLFGVPLAIWILYEAVDEIRKSAGRGEQQSKMEIKTPLILTVVSFLYIVAFYYIGLVPALLGYIFLFMVFFDDSIRQLPRKFVYSLLITGVIYLLYVVIFRVQFDKIFF